MNGHPAPGLRPNPRPPSALLWSTVPLDWVIVGGESGPGARPVSLDWVRGLRDQCAASGIPVFVKQLGAAWARRAGGDGNGGDWAHWPADLRVRDWPRPEPGRQAAGGGPRRGVSWV